MHQSSIFKNQLAAATTDLLTCNIIYDNSYGRVADVRRNEASKPLLAGRVPQLQPDLQPSISSAHHVTHTNVRAVELLSVIPR